MIGRHISHYKILQKLGEGGMGEVYKAQDTKLNRTVALKILSPALLRDEKAKKRFMQEAQAASAMDHSNICTIYEIDEAEDGRLFICMAYNQGKTLKEMIEEGNLEPSDVIRIAAQVASGLKKAHDNGIIHRDIKPANILVDEDGQAKIVDFGLAKLAGVKKITSSGVTMGTVSYMSPEQVLGEDVGSETDIWSLGVVMYEALTGQLPFRSKYEAGVMYGIMNEEPERITELRPDIPEELGFIVEKALAKKRKDRYRDARELLSDLEKLHEQITSEQHPAPRPWHFSRRKRFLIPFIVAVAALVVVSVFYFGPWMKQDGGIPVLSGQPRQVTTGDAWEGEPALSPDGSRIAYASNINGNRDIFITDVHGGTPLQLTSDPAADYYPAWFPDGSALAFVSERSGGTAIWRTGQLGGGATILLPNATDPAISPDGKRIAFATPGQKGDSRIGVASIDDPTDRTILTTDDDGLWNHHWPSWSPDGKRICYAAHNALWLVPVTGGGATRLTQTSEIDCNPVWSSQGTHVFYSSEREGTVALWRIAVGGGTPERITMGTGSESEPSICGDGSRLAYATLKSQCMLLVRNMETGGEAKLPGLRDDLMATLSPNGDRVVYASNRGGDRIDLWVQPLENGIPAGQPSRLTDHPGNASHPIFSPDGEWIAYYRIIDDQRDIWIIPADGGSSIRFTEHPAADIQPAWSQDGSMLAFISERDGGSHIWVAPVENGHRTAPPRRIAHEGVSALAPIWSPDGSHIAFIGFGEGILDAYIVSLDGSEPVRRVTSGANAVRLRWTESPDTILVSGNWNGEWYTLRRVSIEGGASTELRPPVVFGAETIFARFDVSRDGRFLVFSREDIKGNIWILEAESGVY